LQRPGITDATGPRIEFKLFNPNARVLEGELQFPLNPNQVVTGFALDIDGELRAAVPVEKAKGRQVFEDVTRTQVDPALLEATGGNNYKLRIYPLPAAGTRRVVLDVIEALDPDHDRANKTTAGYRLPLAFPGSVAQLDVLVHVAGAAPKQVSAHLGAVKLDARGAQPSGAEVRLSRRNHEQDAVLMVDVAAGKTTSFVVTGEYRGESYFYAELPAPRADSGVRARPSSVGILWDASGSAEARDRAREFSLLDAYFRSLAAARVNVELIVVRDIADPARRFTVEGGDWRALRRYLEGQVFDGATNLGHMRVPDGVEVALLFTDGLGNYGSEPLPASTVPLYAVNTAIRANPTLLRIAAERSGAFYLDLNSIDTTSALKELHAVRPRLVDLRATGAERLVAASSYPQNGYIQLAGVLKANGTDLILKWQGAKGKRTTQTLRVSSQVIGSDGAKPLAALRWASLSLQALEQDPQRNQAAIRRLGAHFGLATAHTSLIVLDAVEDYVRYDIEPPPPLLAQYRQLAAAAQSRRVHLREKHLELVALRFGERAAWWEKEYPKGEPPPMSITTHGVEETAPVTNSPPPSPRVGTPAPRAAAPPAAEAGASESGPSVATIQLKKWTPDAPYIHRLKNTPDDRLYAIYLDERPSYTQSTAFFLDVADMLQERGQRELGLRVLSNLAEMNLEDRHILRILAYRLLQAERVDLALPVLERVLALAPDEPQSWRDLGLALQAAGRPQQAIEYLWEVVARPWHQRFADIELTALSELNAIVARLRADGIETDVSRIDDRLLQNMPLDLRVVLGWDADNTDIDLWVIDPNGEKAFYGNPLTYQGGRMSQDFTGGYGPETFELRQAKPGTYTVKAQFYGHNQQIVAPATTLMLKLSTAFGTAAQKNEMVTLRLSGAKDEVTVGRFEIK
jgi:tetratricopeptide (TPR) repeat protein